MRIVSWIMVGVLLFTPLALGDAEPEPVEFSFVAVRGSNQPGRTGEKFFGKELESVRKDIANLSYNHFEKIALYSAKIKFGKKTTVSMNDMYTLVVEPVAVDQKGRIQLNTQVVMDTVDKNGKAKPIKALDTVLHMAPDKRLNLGGLKLKDGGDLIIVLSVK